MTQAHVLPRGRWRGVGEAWPPLGACAVTACRAAESRRREEHKQRARRVPSDAGAVRLRGAGRPLRGFGSGSVRLRRSGTDNPNRPDWVTGVRKGERPGWEGSRHRPSSPPWLNQAAGGFLGLGPPPVASRRGADCGARPGRAWASSSPPRLLRPDPAELYSLAPSCLPVLLLPLPRLASPNSPAGP